MNLKNMRKKAKAIALPTMSVGGVLPTKENQEKINTETKEKIEKYRLENPTKPVSEELPLNAPIEIKNEPYSIENEYIDLAKRYLDMNTERTPTLVDFAKAAISKVDKLNSIINELKKPRNDGFSRTLYSSDAGGSWN